MFAAMGSERNMRNEKSANILKCRHFSVISLFLLVLQLSVSSCSYLTDNYCLKHTTDVILEEKKLLFIWPHRNTTTVFLTSSLCDFSLTLNFSKEDLISDHIENVDGTWIKDVDGNLWGVLYYFLDQEAINITLIKNSTTHPIQDSSCIARHNIRVTFDASSPADVAFLTTSCFGVSSDNTNGYGSLDDITGNSYNYHNYAPTYTTSTTRIPTKLITFIIFGLVGLVAFACRLCWMKTPSSSSVPKHNMSAPTALPYNRFYSDDGSVGLPNSSGPVPNSSDPVPNSNAPVPPYPSGPVPNSNAKVPPSPSDSVPPYSTSPSSTYGSNITYIYDTNGF